MPKLMDRLNSEKPFFSVEIFPRNPTLEFFGNLKLRRKPLYAWAVSHYIVPVITYLEMIYFTIY